MARKTTANATFSDAEVTSDTLDRLAQVRKKLDAAQNAISLGRVAPAETEARLNLFENRETYKRAFAGGPTDNFATAADLNSTERVIGTNDILLIDFFHRGLIAARSVGCVLTMGERCATGFLVAPHILMTNHHVLPKPETARASSVVFELSGAVAGGFGNPEAEFDPDRFWFTDKDLDVTLVAVADVGALEAAELGWHPMISQQGKIRIGDPINIIQYPGARQKSVVVHNSNLLHLENDTKLMPYIWYSSDTERGSSGSPIFNRHWEVVGVHHRGVPRTNSKGELLDINDKPIPRADFERNSNLAVWIANEGSRTSQIVAALESAVFKNAPQGRERDGLLALWNESRHFNKGQATGAQSAAVGQETSSRQGVPRSGAERSTTKASDVIIQITINSSP